MLLQNSARFAGVILLLHLFSVGTVSNGNDITVRIVGGTKANIANIQYLVQLLKNQVFICGGSLVSKRFVITAAHCVVGIRPRQLTVAGGTSSLSVKGVRRKVKKIIIPKSFSMKNMSKDVAVLKLAEPMTGPKISPIALNTRRIKAGMAMKVSGWGLRSENANGPAQHVRTVTVPTLSKAKCKAQYSNSLTRTMFCASKPGVKDACSGDSGGPAVHKRKLYGIVSWGNGCARRNFAGVYTSVRAVRKFILMAMKQ